MKCPCCGLEYIECLQCGTKFAPKRGQHRFCTPLCGWRYKTRLPEEILHSFKELVEREVHDRKGTILSASRINRKVLREMDVDYNPNDNRYVQMVCDVFDRNHGIVFKTTRKGKIYKFPLLKKVEK